MEWGSYHTLEEIYTWLDEMVALHPEMTSEVIGTSTEGRPIRVIKISKKTGNPGIFIETNIHAREWITSATVTWIIMEMFQSSDPEVIEILENYDWYIVPVLNVDGFEYTHTTVSILESNFDYTFNL
jgi:murein tripeptide amidase MpaA